MGYFSFMEILNSFIEIMFLETSELESISPSYLCGDNKLFLNPI